MSVRTLASSKETTTVDGGPSPLTQKRRPFGGVWFKDKGWRHVVGIVTTIFAVFPLLYVLSAALDSNGTLVGSNGLFSRFDTGNFVALFSDPPTRPFGRWFVNTLVVGTVTSAATVFLGAWPRTLSPACASRAAGWDS